MKRILTLAASLLLCSGLYAQIDPTVEVSRNYKVNVADIEKPISPDFFVDDSLQKFDVAFDYSIFERPYTDLYEFTPYQTDSISKVVRRRPPRMMVQAGTQFPFSPEVMFRSQLVTKPRLNVGIDADFRTLMNKMDYLGEEKALSTDRLGAGVGAHLKHAWSTGELTAGIGVKMDAYNDEYASNELTHNMTLGNLFFHLTSANPTENSVFYTLDFNYAAAAKTLGGLPELDTTYNNSRMSLKGTIGSSFDKHRVYVNMVYQTAISGKGESKVNVGLLEFMPVYEYAQGRFKVRAGARFGNKYIGTDASTTIHPEADFKLELLKNNLWIRAIVSGGNEHNSLVDYIADAPWLCSGLEKSEATATDAIGVRNLESKLSLESIIAGRFAFSPYVAFNNYSHKMQLHTVFSSTGLPLLLPLYSDYKVAQLGFETSWKSKNLTVNANLNHNNAYNGTEEPVNMIADWTWGASMEFNVKRRVFVNASYAYESSRRAWEGEIPDYKDLSVTLTGVINRHISAYVKGGNLLDNMNYRFYEIPEIGRNIGGGVRINF